MSSKDSHGSGSYLRRIYRILEIANSSRLQILVNTSSP